MEGLGFELLIKLRAYKGLHDLMAGRTTPSSALRLSLRSLSSGGRGGGGDHKGHPGTEFRTQSQSSTLRTDAADPSLDPEP